MKVKLKILLKDCKTVDYTDNEDCPLARAFKRVLKRGYYIHVGGEGFFYINKSSNFSSEQLLEGQIVNFNVHVVRNATRSFYRTVDIPTEYLNMN